MEIIIKLLPFIGTALSFFIIGHFLKGWKKEKSNNIKSDYDNRADIAEDWLLRIEKLSSKAGAYYQTSEERRSEILKIIRLSKEHFEDCTNVADDFQKYVQALSKKHHNDV